MVSPARVTVPTGYSRSRRSSSLSPSSRTTSPSPLVSSSWRRKVRLPVSCLGRRRFTQPVQARILSRSPPGMRRMVKSATRWKRLVVTIPSPFAFPTATHTAAAASRTMPPTAHRIASTARSPSPHNLRKLEYTIVPSRRQPHRMPAKGGKTLTFRRISCRFFLSAASPPAPPRGRDFRHFWRDFL